MNDLILRVAYLKRLYQLLYGPMLCTPLERSAWTTKITQGFGIRNPHYKSGIHPGVDHGIAIGTPLFAVCDGFEVYKTFKNNKSMGNACYARFTTSEGTTKWMCFMHLKAEPLKGIYNAAEVFAYSGNTGDSTGPHLHTEMWKVPINRALVYTKTGVLNYLEDPLAWFNTRVR